MPTTWNRSPEDFHKIYSANTDAFYRLGSYSLAKELDEFMTNCALQLWSRGGGMTQRHVDIANEIYSRNQPKPTWMLWSLTSAVCDCEVFMPPVFYWNLAESDAKRGTQASRTFIRMFTNILLYIAACDDDVSLAEAEYITECTDKLAAICDASGVGKAKEALNPMDFVTTSEPGFKDKHPQIARSAAGQEAAQGAQVPAAEVEKPDFDELMAQLESLVGLDDVKKDVKNLINLVKVRRLRQENGLPVPPMSLHMVFMGNPGTGKTTVARLISGLYASIGVLSKGQLVEVDRSGLVAGYVGQTALKTQEAIKSALGGVLFIDEAYSLSSGGDNDFGREAIETILKAGYTGPMEQFLNSNPGLESRFNKYFFFPDYTGEQLLAIFKMQCRKNSYTLTPEAEKTAEELFTQLYEQRGDNFGNGRDVRNCFEDMIVRQSNRVAQMDAPTKDDLMAILPEDMRDEAEAPAAADSDGGADAGDDAGSEK